MKSRITFINIIILKKEKSFAEVLVYLLFQTEGREEMSTGIMTTKKLSKMHFFVWYEKL